MNEDRTRLQKAGMPSVKNLHVIGVFDDDQHAAAAEQALEQAGFSRDAISVLAKPPGSAPHVGADATQVKQHAIAGARAGALLGGLAAVSLLVPGVGTLLAAGPIAAIISGSLLGGSLGSLAGSFVGLGMPNEDAQEYEAMVRAGAEVVTVRAANNDNAASAAHILGQHGAHHIVTHHEHL